MQSVSHISMKFIYRNRKQVFVLFVNLGVNLNRLTHQITHIMIHLAQEVRVAHRPFQVRKQSRTNSSHFFISVLLLIVSIPAAVITLAILVAMVPFRLYDIITR